MRLIVWPAVTGAGLGRWPIPALDIGVSACECGARGAVNISLPRQAVRFTGLVYGLVAQLVRAHA